MITSADELIRLRTSTEKADYDRAAHEPAPLDVWWELVREHADMRFWVAHNKTVPIEILAALADDDSATVRAAVARKRKLPAPLFERLARDPHESVRHSIACNAKTPREILEMLVGDTVAFVADAAGTRLREP